VVKADARSAPEAAKATVARPATSPSASLDRIEGVGLPGAVTLPPCVRFSHGEELTIATMMWLAAPAGY
jgi:hypothetical protein